MIELTVAGSARPALIDDDMSHLAGYRWRIAPAGFVYRHSETRVKLTHAIAGPPAPGFGVVHANGDRMDFRRCNLLVEPAEKCRQRAWAARRRRVHASAQIDLFSTHDH